MHQDPVIAVVGAGQAALQLAVSLRAAGSSAPITLIGDEPHPPYSRPPLFKAYLRGMTEKADLIFRPPEWFAENGVTLMTGTRVLSVDPATQMVRTDRGDLPFGHLVFATGKRPRHRPDLPPDPDNVIYMRGLTDAERTVALLPDVRRIAVVGGGFIGLEFAAVMRSMGCEVTMIEAAPRLLGRAISAPMSGWFHDLHQGQGVDLRLGARLRSVIRDGNRVTALGLEDGSEIAADLVMVGVGVVPNDDLARAAVVATDNGVAVDASLQTTLPGIFAIGDCASLPLPGGRRVRLESVQNAVDQAKHLAAVIRGQVAPISRCPGSGATNTTPSCKLRACCAMARSVPQHRTKPIRHFPSKTATGTGWFASNPSTMRARRFAPSDKKDAPTRTRAAVAVAAGKPLQVMEVNLDDPKDGEVLIEIKATGICHTDEFTLSGADPEGIFPSILGHEGAGVVIKCGPGVTSLKPGDHVIPLYTPECRECPSCLSRKTNLCTAIRATQGQGLRPDRTTRFSMLDGKPIYHDMGCSTFAQHTVMPEIALAKVRDDAPFDKIRHIGCGVTTGIGAVLNAAQVGIGAKAVVFGLGGIGLNVIQGLKMAGADMIIGVDLNDDKKAWGEKFGMTHFVNPKELADGTSVVQAIVDLTKTPFDKIGGADYSFDCTGNVKVMRDALACTHRGWGRSIIIGVAPAGATIETRPFQLVMGRVWKGTAFGSAWGRTDVPKIVDGYMDGKIEIDGMITHILPLENINEGFDLMHAGKSIRAVGVI